MYCIDKFVKDARRLALTNPLQFKHVSLVVNKNKIISIGTNSRKTHPLGKKYNYVFEDRHSELDAWIRVPYRYRQLELTLLNYRFNKQGQIRLSKPCCKCESWVKACFAEIYYSNNSGEFVELS